jgi:hypothetical protein
MANFNLADYDLVENRVKQFYSLYEDGRIVTENMSTKEDRERGHWVFKARIYLTQEDQRLGLPKATGYAHEIDGGPGANRFSAAENCETSAIGRALANFGMSGNLRPSRSEMAKVQRMEQQAAAPKAEPWAAPLINWDEELTKLDSVEGARGLFALAKAEKASKAILDAITAKGKELATD